MANLFEYVFHSKHCGDNLIVHQYLWLSVKKLKYQNSSAFTYSQFVIQFRYDLPQSKMYLALYFLIYITFTEFYF